MYMINGQILAPSVSALPPFMAVVFRKEPGMVVRLCTGHSRTSLFYVALVLPVRRMYGQILAPAVSVFPPSMVVVCHERKD